MPFEHAATTVWGRWLRSVSANRAPNQQIVGQDIEDSLRAVILAADVRNMTAPVNWAQAGMGRASPGGGAGTLARIEMLSSPLGGGTWIDSVLFLGTQAAFYQIEDAPTGGFVFNRDGFCDLGQIPAANTVAVGTVVEAFPAADRPSNAVNQISNLTQPWFVPPGKIFVIRAQSQTGNLNLRALWWREIPSVQTP